MGPKFMKVISDNTKRVYAVVVVTDKLRSGYSRLYRWIPNFQCWVRDPHLFMDWRSFDLFPLNEFVEISEDEAEQLAQSLRRFDGRRSKWILDLYSAEPERLSMADIGLACSRGRSVDAKFVEDVKKARLGRWVPVRKYSADKGVAARKFVSEVRLGKRKLLADIGPMEACVRKKLDGSLMVFIRRAVNAELDVVSMARVMAEEAHAGQVDKAGRPYISHPGRVADSLEKAGYGPDVVAVGWLHDVLEDTSITADMLIEAGFPQKIVQAVECISKISGEPLDEYISRVKSNELSLSVKIMDVKDNMCPERLNLLDPDTKKYLTNKYRHTLELLGNKKSESDDSA